MVDAVVGAVVEAESGDDAAGRVGVCDDAVGTLRVDVAVNPVVDSEAEAKGEPVNDADADGTGPPELTGLGLQVLRSFGVLSPPLFRGERAACLPSAARRAGSFSKLCPAWTTATAVSTARSDTLNFITARR